MALNIGSSDLKALTDLATSSQHLIAQFLASLSSSTSDATLPANPPNPLHVLRDSASLLKAQTTKLSLLLINKPFTPSALVKVIREISATCLPAMMSAVELCVPEVWGNLLRQEVQGRVRSVMREMEVCMREVLDVARAEEVGGGKGKTKAGEPAKHNNRDTLASTGVVWEACDSVIELENVGIGGLAMRKAELYRDMIKDAIEELQEWGEDDAEVDEDDFAGSDGEDDEDSDKDSIEDIFSAANKLPKDRKDLKELLESSTGNLKKIGMLYAALTKRRLKTFTSSVAGQKKNVQVLDDLMDNLKMISETVDDLASAFYELDSKEASTVIRACIDEAHKAITLVRLGWDGKEDEFTSWSGKWIEVVK